jgi:hypothetical protein
MVVLPPRLDGGLSIAQADEPMVVKTFVAESSLAALDEGVLDQLSWLDEA